MSAAQRSLAMALLGALLGALGTAPAVAQTTVYESKDKVGPVFSDRPSSGAAVAPTLRNFGSELRCLPIATVPGWR